MNKLFTLVAIALVASFTSNVSAQCVGCSQGVSPTFNQSYSQPMQSYSQPMQSYAQPMQSYSQPMQSYSQPMQSYAQPMQSYSQPIYSGAIGTVVNAPAYNTMSSGCSGCCNGCGASSQPVFNGGYANGGMIQTHGTMSYGGETIINGGTIVEGSSVINGGAVVQPTVAQPAVEGEAVVQPGAVEQTPVPQADTATPPVPTPDNSAAADGEDDGT